MGLFENRRQERTMPAMNPNFAWAQRKDRVFDTIEVPNCDKKASTVNIEGQSLKFKGKTDAQEYELDIELYGELNTEESKYTIGDRNVQILLMRKEEGEHWPRLLKESKKMQNMKVDWSKWVEEDEEDGADPMGGMGGMGDMDFGGGDSDDSDAEDLPDLETGGPD